MKYNFTSIFFIVLLSICTLQVSAQQDPHFTQFMFNKLGLNSGYAGDPEKICATLFNRTQWLGFGGGTEANGPNGPISRGAAPSNLLASVNTRIGDKIGVGLLFLRDELGFETSINPQLSLSYRHTFQNQGVLSSGIGVGLIQKTLRGDELKALDPNDPLIPAGDVTGSGLDVNFGLYYTLPQLSLFDNFYAGVSATHLNQVEIPYGNYSKYNAGMHYYIMTGAEYVLNSEFTLEPNLLIKKDPAKIQADINCFLVWNQNIRGGLTWRPMDAVSVLLGYQFPIPLMVGYSYDLTTTKILGYSSGSHEIMLRYCFGIKHTPKTKIIIPRLTPRFM